MLANKIIVRPLNWFERFLDILMIPIMYGVSGTRLERPQQTHAWNNTKLTVPEIEYLDPNMMVHQDGDPEATLPGRVRFHLPVAGGWRKYVVLSPEFVALEDDEPWFIGWVSEYHTTGVSRIPLHEPVRMLVGPGKVLFFAITADGTQLELTKIGEGKVGDAGEFCQLPLL